MQNALLFKTSIKNKFYFHDPILENQICNLTFPNPVGLAGGFDKNANMTLGLSLLGFGFIELGTITNLPQSGNAKPRLFRHEKELALQNSMGFNNDGALKILERIKTTQNALQNGFLGAHKAPILGINIGKNKDVPNSNALKDYEKLLKSCDVGDFFVFNLSSPNTKSLRDLQNESFVGELFEMTKKITKPIFIKISPDMEIDNMLKICQRAIDSGASGIIATNTSTDYSLVKNPAKNSEGELFGGISGEVLKTRSQEILKILSNAFFKKTVLISTGGISSAQDVLLRLKIGASLVQIYTSFIYSGPSICKNINTELASLLKREGFTSIKQIIGSGL